MTKKTTQGKGELLKLVEQDNGEMFYQRNIQNPYPSESQSYTAFKKGFELGWKSKNNYDDKKDKTK